MYYISFQIYFWNNNFCGNVKFWVNFVRNLYFVNDRLKGHWTSITSSPNFLQKKLGLHH